MRRYLTIGFDQSGKAEIIRQSSDERHEHVVGLHELEDNKSFEEVVVVEVGGRSVLKRRAFGDDAASNARAIGTSIGLPSGAGKVPMQESKVGRITLRAMTLGDRPPLHAEPRTDGTSTNNGSMEAQLNGMKVDELKQIAADEGVEITNDAKKADLVLAISAKRRATSAEFQ